VKIEQSHKKMDGEKKKRELLEKKKKWKIKSYEKKKEEKWVEGKENKGPKVERKKTKIQNYFDPNYITVIFNKKQ